MPNFLIKPQAKKEMIHQMLAEQQARGYNERAQREAEAKEIRKRDKIHEQINANKAKQMGRYRKFSGFTEQVKDQLLEAAIYKIAYGALKMVDEAQGTDLAADIDNQSTMHAMIYRFIHESDGSTAIMNNLQRGGKQTYYLAELYNTIEKTFKAILETVDKDDTDTYTINSDITDAYKQALENDDSSVMSEVISDRVAAAIGEFLEGNKRDKDSIVAALTATKNKLDELDEPENDDMSDDAKKAMSESYARQGKRYVTQVRNRKHGLFNEMVTRVSQDVVKSPELRESYMEGTSLNIPKIVDRVTLMYTFLETVNAMRIVKVDADFIKNQIFGD